MTEAATIEQLQDSLAKVERRLREVEDRDAIHRLFLDLQNAIDGRDMVKYGTLFTEDGEWSGVTGRAVGPAAITETMSPVCQPWQNEEERTYHSVSDLTIDLDGDVATARAQYFHLKVGDNGKPEVFHFGRYEAIVHRTPIGWRFKRRAGFIILPYVEPKFQLMGRAEGAGLA